MSNQSIKHWPANERPRERLIHYGASTLSDAELLAILLRTGIAGRSVVQLARELLSHADGVRNLLAMPLADCCQLPGMGMAKYAQLQAALELSKRVLKESMSRETRLESSDHTKNFLRLKLRDRPYEVFVVLFLDVRHQLISYQEMFRGTINGAVVPIREVVKEALSCNASSIVIAHNHPSGIAEPSYADQQLTEKLSAALALVDIRLIDHIIVGDMECLSLAEMGLMQKRDKKN